MWPRPTRWSGCADRSQTGRGETTYCLTFGSAARHSCGGLGSSMNELRVLPSEDRRSFPASPRRRLGSVRWRAILLATSALVPLGRHLVGANPLGPQVVGGSATVQGQGSASVTVRQTTDKAIINWRSFDIGKGETTRF